MRESARRKSSPRRGDSTTPSAPLRPAQAKLDSGFEHDFSRVATHARPGPAEPLPFLDRIQSSFGRFDVSQTRAHFHSAAAASAKANAFTIGEDVAFAARRPALRTAAHEATHVLQQRAGVPFTGRGQGGDPFERQADAVAERVAQGRSSESLLAAISPGVPRPGTVIQFDEPPKNPASQPPTQPSTQPAAQPATQPATQPAATPAPLRYQRSWFTSLTAPDPAMTEAFLERELKRTFTTYDVKGIPAGAPKETRLFLLYLLDEVRGQENWGSEMDLVVPVAWPAKKGDPPPVGRVTVRIDDLGNAVAEYIDKGPVPAAPQTTVAAATPLLIKTYGFASVGDDGTAAWSDAEISDVVEALKMLPPGEKDVLRGVELIRVQDIPGDFAGLFSTGGTSGAGRTTLVKPFLKLATKTFEPELKFYGGTKGTVPSSYDVILHEVGHAVENEKYRPLEETYSEAAVKSNKLGIPVQNSFEEHKKLSDDYAKLYKEWTAAKKAGDTKKAAALESRLSALNAKISAALAKNKAASAKYKPAEKAAETAKKKMKKTLVDAKTVVEPLEADAAAKKTRAAAAEAKIAPVRGLLAKPMVESSQAYADEIGKTSKAIETFSKASKDGAIDTLEEPVLTQIESRDKEAKTLAAADPTHPALATMNLAAAAQDDWFSAERTAARAPKRTLRLQKFVDLVTTNKIAPFTEYAKKNWPHAPAEFYAEAYALWLTDPDFLQNNYGPVYTFFQSGDYRK